MSVSSFKVSVSPAPLRRQAVEALRRVILEGRFQPGDRLIERELCEMVGVSRTCLREALRQLESEGLVSVLSNRGVVVAGSDRTKAEELLQIIAVLNAMLVDSVVAHADPTQLATLQSLLLRQEAADGPPAVAQALREQLDDALFESCGNMALVEILRPLRRRAALARSFATEEETATTAPQALAKRVISRAALGDPHRVVTAFGVAPIRSGTRNSKSRSSSASRTVSRKSVS